MDLVQPNNHMYPRFRGPKKKKAWRKRRQVRSRHFIESLFLRSVRHICPFGRVTIKFFNRFKLRSTHLAFSAAQYASVRLFVAFGYRAVLSTPRAHPRCSFSREEITLSHEVGSFHSFAASPVEFSLEIHFPFSICLRFPVSSM